MNSETKYKLAIESGIGGGSISLFEKGNVLDYRSGDADQRKADHLIEALSEILEKNKIERSEIDVIFYSEYPGSHTGLKIGASVAKGLRSAWAADARPRDLFEGVFRNYKQEFEGKFLIIFPSGRADIIWRIYDEKGSVIISGQSDFKKSSENNLAPAIKSGLTIFMPCHLMENHVSVYDYFGLEKKTELVDLGENLSRFIGS